MTCMNAVFKALADPTRREVLRLLAHGERTAGELAEQFDMTRPSMSHHFAVLKEAGLIRSRREGQQIFYSLDTTVMEDVVTWMWPMLGVGPRPAPAAADKGRGERDGAGRQES